MYKLHKNGDTLVNNSVFEYICDSEEDLAKIPKNKINLGSTAMVVDADKGLRIFISDSKDNWVEITEEQISGGSSSSSSSGASTYTLTADKIKTALGGTDVNAKFSEISEKINSDETKITSLETKNASFETKIASLESKDTNFETRISSLEANPGQSSSGSQPVANKSYELLNEILADGSYSAISLTKDDNENDYNLIAAYVEFETTKASSTASIRIFVNDELVANNVNAMSTSGSGSAPLKSSVKMNFEYGMLFTLMTAASTTLSNNNVQSYGKLLKESTGNISKIEFVGSSSSVKIPSGSVIRVYGVKG